MPFQLGNQEWKKRKVCRGGRLTREELAKQKIEKRELNYVAKIYARVKAAEQMESIFGLCSLINSGVCPVCKQPTT